jgi:FkbM family methyltransferase
MIETLIGQFHLPPGNMAPLRIWDLGANIGLTAIHFASLYREARITAVEAEPGLAEIARLNAKPYGGRVEIIEAAVWPVRQSLCFSVQHGDEYGGKVTESQSDIQVAGIPLNELMAEDQQVDYLKMDIEGAEARVLRESTQWARKVGCIKVEVHGDYTVDACRADLERLGFQTSVDNRHWACVVGTR